VVHRRVTRTTNLLERLFAEERRHTKTIAHAFGGRTEMKPMFTALIRARKTSRGIPISDFKRRRFDALREESSACFNAGHAPPPHAIASRSRTYGTQGT
jgi:hypothetical protein